MAALMACGPAADGSDVSEESAENTELASDSNDPPGLDCVVTIDATTCQLCVPADLCTALAEPSSEAPPGGITATAFEPCYPSAEAIDALSDECKTIAGLIAVAGQLKRFGDTMKDSVDKEAPPP